MTLAVIWNLLTSVLTLALAVLVTEEAGTNFQAMVFLMALIGYHRLTWLIAEDHQAAKVRYLRTETWFHRIDSAIRGTQSGNPVAASMIAGVSDDDELQELKGLVELLAKKRSIAHRIFSVTEVLLLLAAVSVLLR